MALSFAAVVERATMNVGAPAVKLTTRSSGVFG